MPVQRAKGAVGGGVGRRQMQAAGGRCCTHARAHPPRTSHLQEVERLQRHKAVIEGEAQRGRVAAATYARQQASAAARERQAAAAAAATAAAQPRPLRVSTRIDYRFTRFHELGLASSPGGAAGSGGASGAAVAAAAPAFAVEARSSPRRPFAVCRYSDYLEALRARHGSGRRR